jgi:predicted small secreted protein
MFSKAIIALTAISLTLGAAACNTVKGLGRDIESVGEAGDKAIR